MRSALGMPRSNDRCCLMSAPASSAPQQPMDRLAMVMMENSGLPIRDRHPVVSQCQSISPTPCCAVPSRTLQRDSARGDAAFAVAADGVDRGAPCRNEFGLARQPASDASKDKPLLGGGVDGFGFIEQR